MHTRGVGVVVFLLAVVLAGCTGGSPEQSEAPLAPALPEGVDPGFVRVRVLDGEGVPVAGAEVVLVEVEIRNTTDASGQAVLGPLAPGSYRLVVQRLGYSQVARAVQVSAGEETSVEAALEPLQVTVEPYQLILPFTAQILFGESFLDIVTHEATNQFCDPCHFYIQVTPPLVDAMMEVTWERSVSVPGVNEDVFFVMFVDWDNSTTQYRDGTTVGSGYLDDRQAYQHSSAEVKAINEHEWVRLDVHAGLTVAFQMKVDLYWSLGYAGELPEGFTALPPE